MKSTREALRELLAAHGECTVAQAAAELGLNQANIRRHFEVMRAEGLVDVDIQRHVIGRPAYVYRLTERAEELTAHYPRLVRRLFSRLNVLSASDAASDGRPLVEQVFEGVADDVAGVYRPAVTGATLAERVAETSDALKGEGIVDHWRKDEDGYHLMNTSCPYRKAAEASDAPCHADRKTVELLVQAPVAQISRMVDGQPQCEYVVQEIRAAAGMPGSDAGSDDATKR
ncbi:MAG: ArsR family transcriptional regulator [Dehalococcoidia bacterium]|nr:ArsR family transcriptional regulator [Dehalococcoidia bacterium]